MLWVGFSGDRSAAFRLLDLIMLVKSPLLASHFTADLDRLVKRLELGIAILLP